MPISSETFYRALATHLQSYADSTSRFGGVYIEYREDYPTVTLSNSHTRIIPTTSIVYSVRCKGCPLTHIIPRYTYTEEEIAALNAHPDPTPIPPHPYDEVEEDEGDEDDDRRYDSDYDEDPYDPQDEEDEGYYISYSDHIRHRQWDWDTQDSDDGPDFDDLLTEEELWLRDAGVIESVVDDGNFTITRWKRYRKQEDGRWVYIDTREDVSYYHIDLLHPVAEDLAAVAVEARRVAALYGIDLDHTANIWESESYLDIYRNRPWGFNSATHISSVYIPEDIAPTLPADPANNILGLEDEDLEDEEDEDQDY